MIGKLKKMKEKRKGGREEGKEGQRRKEGRKEGREGGGWGALHYSCFLLQREISVHSHLLQKTSPFFICFTVSLFMKSSSFLLNW